MLWAGAVIWAARRLIRLAYSSLIGLSTRRLTRLAASPRDMLLKQLGLSQACLQGCCWDRAGCL